MRRAPIRGPKGRERRKIAPFSAKTHLFETATKKGVQKFAQFFRVRIFLSVGSLADKTAPQPTKPRKRDFPVKLKNTNLSVGFEKVAQCERGSDESPLAQNLPVGAQFGPSPCPPDPPPTHDEMAPSPPQSAPISDPRGTSDPKRGSLRPHSACGQIWSGGVSPRTAPKSRKIHFPTFLAHFGPRAAAKFLEVPQTPQN